MYLGNINVFFLRFQMQQRHAQINTFIYCVIKPRSTLLHFVLFKLKYTPGYKYVYRILKEKRNIK